MMQQLTTYTAKSRLNGFVMVFRYHLEGNLQSFEILEGTLLKKQIDWFFSSGNFPYYESMIKSWLKGDMRKHFEIVIGEPDLSFEAFWELYGHKTRKKETQDHWEKKMDAAERIKTFMGLKKYNNHLRLNTWKNKVDPIRYLKHKRYEDEF